MGERGEMETEMEKQERHQQETRAGQKGRERSPQWEPEGGVGRRKEAGSWPDLETSAGSP